MLPIEKRGFTNDGSTTRNEADIQGRNEGQSWPCHKFRASSAVALVAAAKPSSPHTDSPSREIHTEQVF
jgi:hypothetical protein